MAITTTAVTFNATTSGTGDFVVLSAYPGKVTPASANVTDGKTYSYIAQSADGTQQEQGSGTYTIGTATLKRTTITWTSNDDTNIVSFLLPPIVSVFPSPVPLLEPLIDPTRISLYAAPFDAMAYNNIALNADQSVSQQYGFLGTGTGFVAGTGYATDQYVVETAGAAVTNASHVTDAPPGFAFSLKLTLTTAMASPGATDLYLNRQPIEGFRAQRLNLGTANAFPFTVSEWVKTNVAGTYYGFTLSSGSDRVYLNKVTLVANTWTFVTYTVPAITTGTFGSNTAKAIDVGWCLSSGSSRRSGTASGLLNGNFRSGTDQVNWAASLTGGSGSTAPTFQRTGLFIFPGTDAPQAAQTPLLVRTVDLELFYCRRYFYAWNYAGNTNENFGVGAVFATNVLATAMRLPNTMRAIPTMTFSTAGDFLYLVAGNASNPTSIGLDVGAPEVVELSFGVIGTTGQAGYVRGITVNARLYFDARL